MYDDVVKILDNCCVLEEKITCKIHNKYELDKFLIPQMFLSLPNVSISPKRVLKITNRLNVSDCMSPKRV